MSGEAHHTFAIGEAESGRMIGLAERASRRLLRQAPPGVLSTCGPSARGTSATGAPYGSRAFTPRTSTAARRAKASGVTPRPTKKAVADEDGVSAASDRIPF
jgi:hypothetical protein